MNESSNNKKNQKLDNKWKAFQYLLQFGIWGIMFSIYIACYFVMTPFVHTFEGWMLAGFSILGFGTASFFLIGVVVFYHDLKGKRMVKFFGLVMLFVLFFTFIMFAPQRMSVVTPVDQQADPLDMFLDPLGGFKELGEENASIVSTYCGYCSLDADDLAKVDKEALLNYLEYLTYHGFKETREGAGEIPNLINCYLVADLLSQLPQGKKFLEANMDLFIEFVSIESTLDFLATVREGKQTALTKENLFRDHLEMRFYALKTMQVLLGNQFDEFLSNLSLNFELSHDHRVHGNTMELAWESEDVYYQDDVILNMDVNDIYYASELMALVTDVKFQGHDMSHTLMMRLFNLDALADKLLSEVEFNDQGYYKLKDKQASNAMRMTLVVTKALSNLHRLDRTDARLVLNYTAGQQVGDTFMVVDQQNDRS